ncbi:LysR family transcriptional regulator [Mycobacteroides immunogenum]|uniref:LysR family transcriptional regulator n=1 Tax=Mycobacteroides immunogenum TaxID=83262 RepID=UPI0025B76AAB|nr:LysR family transcriptional regulator [Mycobacteroides immunogenum]WJR34802.1 LysR family transcriptional regulator [Mycobacteroides immunogenum]
MDGFSLVQIRNFIAVADSGSFTEAGKLVDSAQSAVSTSVKRFEEALGVELFNRHSSSGVVLTPAGEEIYQLAHRITADCASLDRWKNAAKDPTLTIGCVQAITPTVLHPLFRSMRTIGVKGVLTEGNDIEIVQSLERQKCDIAIALDLVGLEMYTERGANLKFESVTETPVVAIAHSRHPIARQGAAPLSHILRYRLAVIENSANSQLIRYLDSQVSGSPLKITGVKTLATLQALVKTGTHVGFVPEHLITPESYNSQMTIVTMREELPAVRLGILYKNGDRSAWPDFVGLKSAAQEALKSLMG